MKIIGITGLKGSGKDTIGQFFEQQYDYTTISFADSLKDCVSVIFGWDRDMLEGRTQKSRIWREQNDPWWAERLSLPFFSPRLAMTTFGTDVMRRYLHDDIWIINTERKILQHERVVLTDIRFPNELALVNRLSGYTIRVNRTPEPEWINAALKASGGCVDSIREMELLNIHESEWLLLNYPTDDTLDNNGSISDLYQGCERIGRMLHP